MYNFLVTSKSNAWDEPVTAIDVTRCIRASEYSNAELAGKFENLDSNALSELLTLPCIFAYEANGYRTPGTDDPKFGFIRKVTKGMVRRSEVLRVEPDIRKIEGFLTAQQLFDHADELEIGLEGWEMMRTHWAIKDVELPAILRQLGIVIPSSRLPIIDVRSHFFDVALSFPGEARAIVEEVATELLAILGKYSVFYDNHFQAQLARPNLDTLLQDIYRNRSKLVVVFLSSHLQAKEWCGIEFRAVRDMIKTREDNVMFIRTDDGFVEGTFSTDGYIDARDHDAKALANLILERINLAQQTSL
jgi:hypothetical protein